MAWKRETEWQVVEGGDVIGDMTKKEAEKRFRKNKKATELRKVIWREWVDKGEGYYPVISEDREEVMVKQRKLKKVV